MATTDRAPMGIAHLTVVPEGLDGATDERPADEEGDRPDSGTA